MTLTRRQLASIAVAGVTTGAAGVWLLREGGRPAAPELTYTLLDGSQVHTSGFRGQVLLINFWATTCSTCLAKMPDLIETQRRLGPSGLRTLAVAMQYDPPVRVADFAQARQLPFGVVIDNTGRIAARFGDVQQTPTTFLIDRHGQIAKRFVGAPDLAELNRTIQNLLAEA